MSARELAIALDYSQRRNFQNVFNRAMIACENSGHIVSDDFAKVSKIVDAGISSKPVLDYELSRYACYLIVQNGDSRKEVIALNFAVLPMQPKVYIKKHRVGGMFSSCTLQSWQRSVRN